MESRSGGETDDHEWAERPLAMIIEILRFFLAEPGGCWKRLAPVSDSGS